MLFHKDFVFTNNLSEAISDEYKGYCLHVICLKGFAAFDIGGRHCELNPNDVMIKSTAKLVRNLECTDNLEIEALLISFDYLDRNCPQADYQVTGYLSTVSSPVFSVDAQDIRQLQHDFHDIRYRLSHEGNNFINDIMRHEVQLLILDIYDAHSRSVRGSTESQARAAEILKQFITLLQEGRYRENRRVDYYASRLFVSPKYLSEACVSASGYNASYWIERYTTDAISHELVETGKTLQELTDEYRFSTVSSFSRYVKEHLHATPLEYRRKKGKLL